MLSPTAVRASPITEVEPDLLVLPRNFVGRELYRWEPMTALVLSIEILSPGTHGVDRGKKRSLYMTSGIAEYWIVDLDERVIEVWYAGAVSAQRVSDELQWAPVRGVPPLTMSLTALFDEVMRDG